MYRTDDKNDYIRKDDKQGEDVYSKGVRAGKRTYFFDVKSTKGGDYYLTITESKKHTYPDGSFSFDKHKIFLYKEDFDKFAEGLDDAVRFIKANVPESEYFHPNKDENDRQQDAAEDIVSLSFEEL